MTCVDGSCYLTNNICYGVVDSHTNKLHKISFSKVLCKFITKYDSRYITIPLKYTLGCNLQPGQKSESGLYAIMDSRKNQILRIQIDPNIAELLTQCGSRYLAVVWLNYIVD